MVAQATGAGGDGDDISATRALGASPVAGPGNRRSTGTAGLRPCVPRRPCRPRAPRAAPHPTAPHCRLPAPRCHLPGLAGARGPHKLLTPGRGRTEANPVWTAGASARVRTPGRPDGPLARGVRTGLQRLPPALSARPGASSRGASIAGPREPLPSARSPVSDGPSSPGAATRTPILGSLDPWSVALAQPPAPTGRPRSTPGKQLLQLERVAGSGEGGLCARACALPRPGGGPRRGWRKAFD